MRSSGFRGRICGEPEPLAAFPILPFDAGCVAAYRVIVETVGYSKRKVIDRMIAATALVHGMRVIT